MKYKNGINICFSINKYVFRSCIIDAFERSKQKYNPHLIGDVPYPTVTYDELHRLYESTVRRIQS